ncbi:MAG: hypothetical protein ACQXXH_06825 [Candidatus Bathyarchaeia archaeon]|nr:hypothetical protein [Candidatus Bathyarchaeota archaeon A05DMB-4]MDH7595788.1 hypothetical protein [Candidatus Bathyarchaeota archaeon]
MIPIPISTPQILTLVLFSAFVLFIVLFLPAILELRKPKDAGPRRIFEADGKEVVGFDILFAVYFREKTNSLFGFLEDIEPQEPVFPVQNSFSLALPDIEF